MIYHLILHADYDDGFIAYLNGTEIMRSNNCTFFPTFNTTIITTMKRFYIAGGSESKLFSFEDFFQIY